VIALEKIKSYIILSKAKNALESIMKQNIESYGLTMNEFSVLEVLNTYERLMVNEIIQKVLIPNSSLTYVLERLESKGYISRIQCTSDKRAFYISITTEGKSLMNEILPKHFKFIQNVYGVLSDNEVEELNRLLKKIGYHAEKFND